MLGIVASQAADCTELYISLLNQRNTLKKRIVRDARAAVENGYDLVQAEREVDFAIAMLDRRIEAQRSLLMLFQAYLDM